MFVPRRVDDPDPEPNPDTPPDSADPSGLCPRCARVSNFHVLGSLPVTLSKTLFAVNRDGSQEPDVEEQVTAFLCMGCDQATVVVEEKTVGGIPIRTGRSRGGTIRYRGLHWWPLPAASGLSDAVPAAIRDCFSEGLRCLGAGAPRGAAVMFGRTLEAIVVEKGSAAAKKVMADRSLAAGLKVMADEKDLEASLAEWAGELRLARNAGGHFNPPEDVKLEEASELSKLLRELLKFLFEVPAQLRRSRATAEQGGRV